MKILIFNWRDINHPLSGGAEISLFEHAKYWKKMNNDVTWFSSSFKNAKKEERIDGIRFIRKGSHYTVHIWAFLYYLKKKFGKVDVVIDSFHFIPFFTPLYIPSDKIVGLINEIAGKVWFENLNYFFALIGFYLEPLLFKFYNKNVLITGSESTKKELIKVGLKRSNIRIIHHGVNIVKNNLKKETIPTIIFLGRISFDKGIKDALDIFVKIAKENKTIRLWIVGKEEKPKMMESMLRSIDLNIKAKIKYFGFVSEKKKFELLKRAWILIHPSKKEGWGLNVIEAASQGTPTVGYNVEGLRDSVKNGETGILVSPSNTGEFIASVNKMLNANRKNLYLNFSNKAIDWSKQFNWDTSSKQSLSVLIAIYEKNIKKYD